MINNIIPDFDFNHDGINLPSDHSEIREIQNALMPEIFNEYERLLNLLCIHMGDPVFTDVSDINETNIGAAIRKVYLLFDQKSDNLETYKFDKAGGTITGSVTITPSGTETEHVLTAPIFSSSVATGTAPMIVVSTTCVSNLNADLHDGRHAGTLSGQIPINGQGLCTALDSDLWDGQHSSDALIFKNATDSISAFRIQASDSDAVFTVDTTNKRIGISVAPSVKFHIKSSGELVRMESTSARGAGNSFYTIHDATGAKANIGFTGPGEDSFNIAQLMDAPMNFYLKDGIKVKILASGSTGIKNLAPDYDLDVTGTIRASTDVRAMSSVKIGSTGQATITYNATEASIDFIIG